MVQYSDHTLYGRSEHDMTNSNGRNIAIVTGSALGLGYELTKRLINNAGQPSFKTPTAYEASDVDRCLKGLKGMILWSIETLKACEEQDLEIANVMSTAGSAAMRTNPCTVRPNGARRGTRRASRPHTRARE